VLRAAVPRLDAFVVLTHEDAADYRQSLPAATTDLLVRSFGPVAREHPDWQLHLYGRGRHRRVIAPLIHRLGLDDQARLQGFDQDFKTVLASSSVFAMSSRSEGFPMALLEAMSVGLPIVVFDCPRGPGEIIRDGHNGLLVAAGDTKAFGSAHHRRHHRRLGEAVRRAVPLTGRPGRRAGDRD
jgi:glycosyltransferase involved in cell wall biosynthesis